MTQILLPQVSLHDVTQRARWHAQCINVTTVQMTHIKNMHKALTWPRHGRDRRRMDAGAIMGAIYMHSCPMHMVYT